MAEISKLITAYEDTLEEMVFLNIWHANSALSSRINSGWNGRFAITDLVLISENPAPHRKPSPVDEEDPKDTLDIDLFGEKKSMHLQRWGSQLQRVRLENSTLESTQLDEQGLQRVQFKCLKDPFLSQIRILILSPYRPAQVCHFSLELVDFAEGSLANKIASYGPKRLRYIAVGLDNFCVQSNGVVMPFRHAWMGGYG